MVSDSLNPYEIDEEESLDYTFITKDGIRYYGAIQSKSRLGGRCPYLGRNPNGWKANYPFSRWSRLANATPAQRKAFVLSRYGIHWPELDEDLCFEGLFADAGIYKPSNAEDTIYYQA